MIWNDRIKDLRQWHKKTLKEVAQKLNVSEVSVRSQLSRGRMWLKERILKMENMQ